MPRPRGRLLRVAKGRKEQGVHEDRHAVGRTVLLRETRGDVERPLRIRNSILKDHHDCTQRPTQAHTQPDAGDLA